MYDDNQLEKQRAFEKLEQLRKKGTVINYDTELASYREGKYGMRKILWRRIYYNKKCR